MESTHWGAAREFDFRDEFAADSPLQRRVTQTLPPACLGTARKRRIPEVDRERVIQQAAGSRRGHRPFVVAAVLIEPGGD